MGPMLQPWLNKGTMRCFHQHFAKADDFVEVARLRENSGMSCDPDHATQHLGRHAVTRVLVDDAFQPLLAPGVITGVAAESIHEHIDAGKDHTRPIRSSRSAERFRSTLGNVPPEALETGKRIRFRVARLGSTSNAFSPSSISEVRVRPFFGRPFPSHAHEIVVLLICQ